MAQQKTYFEITYKAPFKGVHSQLPETEIPGEYATQVDNFILRNGEIRTRPVIKNFLPGVPTGEIINGITAFLDGNGVTHTVITTSKGLYQLNANWRKNKKAAWSLVGLYPNQFIPGINVPHQYQIFLNSVYFVNGSANLWKWDGITSPTKTKPSPLTSAAVVTQSSGLTAGGFFLGELDSRLLLLNTIEEITPTSTQTFSQRIRWSNSGGSVWDNTVDVGAGFNDELDVPDSISGFLTIGRNGFIFRVNGITQMTPITQSLLPFDFNHLWASDRGIGSVYPWSITSFGPTGAFISVDDIYLLTLGGFDIISGESKDAIFTDLALASNNPIGVMVPTFAQNYSYLVYMLCIPTVNGTTIWMYAVKDKSWVRWLVPDIQLTGRFRMVPTA